MKRKLVYIGAAWGTGLLCASVLSYSFDFFILPAALIFLLVFRFVFKGRLKEVILIISAFVLAMSFYRAYDVLVYQKIIFCSENEISFSGKIIEENEYSGDKSSYVLKGRINEDIKAKVLVYTDTLDSEIGDTISFRGKLKVPENTYLFSGKDYYKSEGIFLMSDKISELTLHKNKNISIGKLLNIYKEKVMSLIKLSLRERESGFLISMLFGDKSGLEEQDANTLFGTGIGHIMAVSGIHLMLFSRMVRFVLRKLNVRKLTLFIISEIAMITFSLCCALSPSVVRALCTLTMMYSAPLFFRNSDTLNSLCIVLIIMTVPCPFYILNPSLILTVAGTFGAGVFAPYATQKLKSDSMIQKVYKNLIYLLCVFSAVFPATVIIFGEGSLISPITNMILTPICMTALILAMISAIFIFLKPIVILKAAGILCSVVLNTTEKLYGLEFTHIRFSGRIINYLLVILVIFCISAYFIHKSLHFSVISLMTSAAVFFSFAAYGNFYTGDKLRIAVLGENMGAVVITKGFKADIIDISGDKNNGRFVSKFLEENNINEINSIFICSKPYSSVSVYNHSLKNSNVNNVFLPYGFDVREDMKICGQIPVYSDYIDLSVKYGEYSFSIDESIVNIEYGNFICALTGGKDIKSQFGTNPVLICDRKGKFKVKNL